MPSTFALRSSDPPFIRIFIQPPVAVLGRSADCDIVVDHPSISRKHAEIRTRRDGLDVTDLGSRNGTFLADRPIRQCHAAPGQTVRFGSLSFSVDAQVPTWEEETDGNDDAQIHPSVAHSGHRLSEAQNRVFRLLVAGGSEKIIARKLELSRATVHNHVTAIYRALNVHSRSELLALIVRRSGRL